MRNWDWYSERGGVLSLFFVQCWLNLISCGLSILFLLPVCFIMPQRDTLITGWLLALFCLGAQCAIYVKVISGLNVVRRRRPAAWQLWALCLLDWPYLCFYAILGITSSSAALTAILCSLLLPILWSLYFSRSRRCAAYFGPLSKVPAGHPYHAVCIWADWCLSMPALKHAPPAPVFAALTALLYGQDTARQQQILEDLRQDHSVVLGDRPMEYEPTRRALEELNLHLADPDLPQSEDFIAQWVREKTSCTASLWRVRVLLENTCDHLRRQLQMAGPGSAPRVRRCSLCHTPVRQDAAFCPWCGRPLNP